MGVLKGYRSTNIDEVVIKDGVIVPTEAGRKGVSQTKSLNPYKTQSAATMANMAGVNTVAITDGQMVVTDMEDGSWIQVAGVDFGNEGAHEFMVTVLNAAQSGKISLYLDSLENGECIGQVAIAAGSAEETVKVTLEKKPAGVHDLYFGFEGTGYQVKDWSFC